MYITYGLKKKKKNTAGAAILKPESHFFLYFIKTDISKTVAHASNHSRLHINKVGIWLLVLAAKQKHRGVHKADWFEVSGVAIKVFFSIFHATEVGFRPQHN